MKLLIFAVRDRATDQYGTPMFLISSGHAVRSFSDEINRPDKDSLLYRHPEDYELFALGVFDTDTAQFETYAPRSVCTGSAVVVREDSKGGPALRSVS